MPPRKRPISPSGQYVSGGPSGAGTRGTGTGAARGADGAEGAGAADSAAAATTSSGVPIRPRIRFTLARLSPPPAAVDRWRPISSRSRFTRAARSAADMLVP
ncbi:hypothetical protein E1265_29110 [Streptomyces sp. 8K308]|nr:hypothetical protein E1265_29110 [Streptomyces sp. 8K308]